MIYNLMGALGRVHTEMVWGGVHRMTCNPRGLHIMVAVWGVHRMMCNLMGGVHRMVNIGCTQNGV